MSIKTIQYVKEAEERAEKLELDSLSKLENISVATQTAIEERKKQLSSELNAYERDQQKEYDQKITIIKEKIDQEIADELNEMNRSIQLKQTDAVNDIVNEVISRYGNS